MHNRVSRIGKVAARLAELVPEARVAAAHGQMNEHELERIMVRASGSREHDVLVVHHDRRVRPRHPQRQHARSWTGPTSTGWPSCTSCAAGSGAARERAYAYFLFPPERPLTETAHERLATIAQHTEIGRGHVRGA